MVKDNSLYLLLEVDETATDLELKKAYKKKAIQFHPDKCRDADAEEKFKAVGEAYKILSDGNTRAVYDKYGLSMDGKQVDTVDPTDLFSKMFGGEAFFDVIGEVSLIKDMTGKMEASMNEEEKEKYENDKMEAMSGGQKSPSPPVQSTISHTEYETHHSKTPHPPTSGLATPPGSSIPTKAQPTTAESSSSAAGSMAASTSAEAGSSAAVDAKKKAKLTPEQRAKIAEHQKQMDEAKEKRISHLVEKLKERIRPFCESACPGEMGDFGTHAFEKKMLYAAEELKMASFGIELLILIGTIYLTKGSTYLNNRKSNAFSNWFRKVKSKGGDIKEMWNLLGSAVSVQMAMLDLQKEQEKGTDELKVQEMEKDMTAKMLSIAWKGTRFEVTQILREVCDRLLSEPNVPEDIIIVRAKALMVIGALWRETKPDADDEQRRELEHLVASADAKKSSKKEKEKDSLTKEKHQV